MDTLLISDGNLRVGQPDTESVITGYGKHDRVVAFQPKGNELYTRVDHKYGIRTPTADEVLRVARLDQDVRGKWRIKAIEPWADGKSTDFTFERA